MNERMQKWKERGKRWSKEGFAFLTSRIFLKNFGALLALMLVLLLLTSWWMRCYTHHGESLQVQDFIGLSLEDAVRKARKRSFEIVVNDSLFIVGKAPHEILEQTPPPLSRVKEGRKIYVSITKKTPDLMPLPDIIGGNDDYNQYRRSLGRLSINTKVKERRFSNKLEPNTILEVWYEDKDITDELRDGFKVPMGSTLEVVVTERSGGSVQIPQLVCKNFDAANFLIGNYNLNIGSIIPDGTVTNQATAYVWRQLPPHRQGARMRIGGQIDIYLTQYRPEDCSSIRESYDRPLEDAGDEEPQNPPSEEEDESFGDDF